MLVMPRLWDSVNIQSSNLKRIKLFLNIYHSGKRGVFNNLIVSNFHKIWLTEMKVTGGNKGHEIHFNLTQGLTRA